MTAWPITGGVRRKEAAQPAVGEPLVAQADVERLDRVRHRRSIEVSVLLDQLWRQDGHVGTLLFRRARRGARTRAFVRGCRRRGRDVVTRERETGARGAAASRRDAATAAATSRMAARRARAERSRTPSPARRGQRRHRRDRHPLRRTIDVLREARRVRRRLELLPDPRQPRHADEHDNPEQHDAAREQESEQAGGVGRQHGA